MTRDADLPDPAVAYPVHVEVDGCLLAQFQQVSGPGITAEPVEVRERSITAPSRLLRRPRQVGRGDLVLERGRILDHSFWIWLSDTRAAHPRTAGRSGSIVVRDEQQGVADRWGFEQAWPTEVEISPAAECADEVLVDSVVLRVEPRHRGRLSRPLPGGAW